MKTKTQNNTHAIVNENTLTTIELHKVGATAIGITSLLIGGWSVACMTAGVIASGGPVALATDYIKAFAG